MLSPSAPVGTAELDGCSIVLTVLLLLHVYIHIYKLGVRTGGKIAQHTASIHQAEPLLLLLLLSLVDAPSFFLLHPIISFIQVPSMLRVAHHHHEFAAIQFRMTQLHTHALKCTKLSYCAAIKTLYAIADSIDDDHPPTMILTPTST